MLYGFLITGTYQIPSRAEVLLGEWGVLGMDKRGECHFMPLTLALRDASEGLEKQCTGHICHQNSRSTYPSVTSV